MESGTNDRQFRAIAPFFVVRNLKESVEYYHRVLGFKMSELWGEPPALAFSKVQLIGKKKKRRPKVLRDENGEFRWETYFVRGKQKRRKVRLIDGKESDWKRYSSMVDELRDRQSEKKNEALVAELKNPAKTPTERFWKTYEEIKREVRILEERLGYHARSKMFMQMAMMIRYGMLKKEELELACDCTKIF